MATQSLIGYPVPMLFKDLDFSTIVIVFAIFMVPFTAVLVLPFRSGNSRSGARLFVAGMALLVLGSVNEMYNHASLRNALVWNSASLALTVLGMAVLLGSFRVSFGSGPRIRWNMAVSLVNALGLVLAFLVAPDFVPGIRTILFSAACLALSLPLLYVGVKEPSRRGRVLSFDIVISIFILVSLARLVFAFLDLRNDDFLPIGIDAALFSLIEASGLGTIMVLALAMWSMRRETRTRKRRPLVSLAKLGLTPSEIDSALAILDGRTVKEIAADFDITESTVRNTLSHAYRKLGITDMTALVALKEKHDIVK